MFAPHFITIYPTAVSGYLSVASKEPPNRNYHDTNQNNINQKDKQTLIHNRDFFRFTVKRFHASL